MGFFDFVKKAVNVVKGIVVEHSPVVQGLGSLAGMVAHAIPMLGPVIDCAVPALNAIFSDDSPPPEQRPPPTAEPLTQEQQLDRQLNRPLELNLKRTEAEIQRVFNSVNDLKRTLEEGFASRQYAVINKLDEILAYHRHDKYNEYLGAVRAGVNYFKDNEQTFRELTASSGAGKFNTIFHRGDGGATLVSKRDELQKSIYSMSVLVEDKEYTPSQEMLELYLYGLHWLLMFHKATIVTRGLKARAHFANKETGQYLDTISSIRQDIKYLQADAKRSAVLLQNLYDHLLAHRQKKIKPEIDGSIIKLNDSWPVYSIGWMPPDVLRTKLKLDSLSTPYNALPPPAPPAEGGDMVKYEVDKRDYEAAKLKYEAEKKDSFEDTTTVIFYREVARRNLEAYLTPAQAVIDSLTDSVRHWNSRLPVTPLNPLPQGEPPHITATPVPKPKTPSEKDLTSDWWRQEVSYAVSYVNQYGEGPESEWTPLVHLKKGVEEVRLDLHPVVFQGDPTMGFKPVKTERGGDALPEKGIRRRIYVKWKPKKAENYLYDFVMEVEEAKMSVVHRVVRKKEEGEEGEGEEEEEDGDGGKAGKTGKPPGEEEKIES